MDESLELFFESSGVLLLIGAIMMFSSMLRMGHRFECAELIVVDKRCIFAKSLMGTTMQDGGTRERSMYNNKDKSVSYYIKYWEQDEIWQLSS